MKFKKNILVFSVLLSTAPLSFASSSDWSYEDISTWGSLSPDYHLCRDGASQSPVDIRQTVEGLLPPLTLIYPPKQSSVVNNGHTVQINIKDGSEITLEGKVFTLRQFHFHTPSENRISGKSYPLEVHFVHSSDRGELAVLGVMFESGAENPALQEILSAIPARENDEVTLQQPLDMMALIPEDRAYFRFSGSLTTPPCTEGVRWVVFRDPVSASEPQLEKLKSVLGEHGNSRATQPLNARVIIR